MKKVARGMVFGVFDGLHEGHKYFLREAAARCRDLVVVVAQDETVRALKSRSPRETLVKRMQNIAHMQGTFIVVPGDEREGEWNVLAQYRPDCVLIGHDQRELRSALTEKGVTVVELRSFKPDTYKSSVINDQGQKAGGAT